MESGRGFLRGSGEARARCEEIGRSASDRGGNWARISRSVCMRGGGGRVGGNKRPLASCARWWVI